MISSGLSHKLACGRSLAEIVGSNPTGGMDICLLWVSCVVRYRYLRRADHSSRGVLPTVLRRRVWSRNIKNGCSIYIYIYIYIYYISHLRVKRRTWTFNSELRLLLESSLALFVLVAIYWGNFVPELIAFWEIVFRFPERQVIPSPKFLEVQSWLTYLSVLWIPLGLSPGIKRPWHEATYFHRRS